MLRRFLLILLCSFFLGSIAVADERVELTVDSNLHEAAKSALADLTGALRQQEVEVIRNTTVAKGKNTRLVIGIAGQSPSVDQLLEQNKIGVPRQSESLCVAKVLSKAGTTIVIAGRDDRGLSYALLDVARVIEMADGKAEWLDAIPTGVEEPCLRHRSVTVHSANRDLEEDWYYDEAFWREYFAMLARGRFNNFTLTFADQMNYLNPVYAHLVDVPGFDDVKASDVTPNGKRRNLKMLRRITELADERGVDFTFGVWTQQPVEKFGGEITVKNMPKGRRFMEYCSRGLTAVLKACPSIDAVQFRMNAESGIDEDEQTDYYQSQFDAIRNCGRPIKLELRYKGLRQETIDQAIKTGLDLKVSTKFWCEHLGLPYHPTAEDTHYRESRYGYGAMLAKPRDFRVTYRLWTVGSHRLLLWADPNYARRFAESCRLGDGEGFEIFAPLTNKGYENKSGKWRIFADRSYESYRWEQQRYWFYYLAFGRMGYNPKCNAKVWQRELQHRFGRAANDIEDAYQNASQILPLITATRMPSASEWRWWPEMDTGGRLQEYMHTAPGDTAQFYGIRTWKKTDDWWREAWDEFPPGFVEDVADGKLTGKWTPSQVVTQLNGLAKATLNALRRAGANVGNKSDAEFLATQLDLSVHAWLAQFHAEKTMAAMQLGFFQTTGESGRLPVARDHMQNARSAWQRIVAATDGVYHNDLVFGHTKGSKRSRGSHYHSGHWKDRLPEIDADIEDLDALIKKHHPLADRYKPFPAEKLSEFPPNIDHEPIESVSVGEDLTIRAKVASRRPIKLVRLHFRPLDQTADWQHINMKTLKGDQYEAIVSFDKVKPRWDFMYYIEALDDRAGTLWPSWQEQQPYVVVKVNPAARNRSTPARRINP